MLDLSCIYNVSRFECVRWNIFRCCIDYFQDIIGKGGSCRVSNRNDDNSLRIERISEAEWRMMRGRENAQRAAHLLEPEFLEHFRLNRQPI